jgi:hypothetical protein
MLIGVVLIFGFIILGIHSNSTIDEVIFEELKIIK